MSYISEHALYGLGAANAVPLALMAARVAPKVGIKAPVALLAVQAGTLATPPRTKAGNTATLALLLAAVGVGGWLYLKKKKGKKKP